MSVTVGVVVKKVAAVLLTDKRTWQAIAAIIVGLLMLCILPAMVLLSMFSGVNDIKVDNSALQEQIISNLTPEQKDQMQKLEVSLTAIANEITAQKLDVDPAKAQLIYACAIAGKVQEDDTFIQRYVSCFANAGDDNEVFDRISDEFSITFSTDDRNNILKLYEGLQEKQSEEG